LVKLDTQPRNVQSISKDRAAISFEIFLQDAFSDLEISSIVTTLMAANRVVGKSTFSWKFISDNPGLIEGHCGTIVRAEPAVFDHQLMDFLIVVGGGKVDPNGWMQRVRAMQRAGRPVAILSDAATAYIKIARPSDHPVTTHWRDVGVLKETGFFRTLSTRCSENSGGVITSAGTGYSLELAVSLIADSLGRNELAELGSRLMIQTVRSGSVEQPIGVSCLANMFDPQIERAISIMEEHICDPLATTEIADRIGISIRHFERLFNTHLSITPGRYYRQIRVKKAHALIIETKMQLLSIALATGYSSVSSLSGAFLREFGISPAKVRSSRRFKFL